MPIEQLVRSVGMAEAQTLQPIQQLIETTTIVSTDQNSTQQEQTEHDANAQP